MLLDTRVPAKERYAQGYADALEDIRMRRRRTAKARGGPYNTDRMVSKEADPFYYEGYRRGLTSFFYVREVAAGSDWYEFLKNRTVRAINLRLEKWLNDEYCRKLLMEDGKPFPPDNLLEQFVDDVQRIAEEMKAVL